MNERGTRVTRGTANQQDAQDAHATVQKRRGAYLPHWTTPPLRRNALVTSNLRLSNDNLYV